MTSSKFEFVRPIRPAAFDQLNRLVSFLYAKIQCFRRAVRNRRSVISLLNWDERMLHDIGLSRSDVLAAIDCPITDDPAYRLSLLTAVRRGNGATPRRTKLHLVVDDLGAVESPRHPGSAGIVEIRSKKQGSPPAH